MILYSPSNVSFNVFGFDIYYYSICILLGIVFSFFAMKFLSYKNNKVSFDTICDISPLIIIVSIICARLYYVLLSFSYYKNHLIEIFYIRDGGIAIHGAILGGIVFGYFYLKKKKIKFFPYADIFATVLPLGQAIGRWGNFFNSEAYGIPTGANALIKLFVPIKARTINFIDVEYFHPTFLYESILDLIIFVILFFLYKKTAKNFDGLIFFLYIILYSSVRFILELFRLDTVYYLFNIPFPSIISLILVVVGIIGIIKIKQS